MYWEEIFCVHFFYQNPFQDVESNIQWLKSNVKKFLLRGPYFGGGGGGPAKLAKDHTLALFFWNASLSAN